jgi:hypothetical protein
MGWSLSSAHVDVALSTFTLIKCSVLEFAPLANGHLPNIVNLTIYDRIDAACLPDANRR